MQGTSDLFLPRTLRSSPPQRFLPHLRQKELLREHEIKEVFSNIEDIYEMHVQLQKQLRAAGTEELSVILPLFAPYVAGGFKQYVE